MHAEQINLDRSAREIDRDQYTRLPVGLHLYCPVILSVHIANRFLVGQNCAERIADALLMSYGGK